MMSHFRGIENDCDRIFLSLESIFLQFFYSAQIPPVSAFAYFFGTLRNTLSRNTYKHAVFNFNTLY
jgi:hypothetical protein